MSLAITDASLLLGRELEYIEQGYIEIENGRIRGTAPGTYKGSAKSLAAKGFLVIPGFINAHTHIADSIGKDIAVGERLDTRVHPVFGAKKKILEKSLPEHLKTFIRNSAISMMKKGIVAFADFREDGLEGIRLLKEAVDGLPIKCVTLGRINYYSSPTDKAGLPPEKGEQTKQVVEHADGLGLSGANENTDAASCAVQAYSRKKIDSNTCRESKETVKFSKMHTGRSEVDRIMEHLKPDFVIHMTNATGNEMSLVAKNGTGVVICPGQMVCSAQASQKLPKCSGRAALIAIGTDNVMLNSPDIMRELDYAWKASRAAEGEMLRARELLKMVTINAAQILRLNTGCIETRRAADLVFIDKKHADLYPMHDPYAAVVHRLTQNSIRAVMINGRFVD